jgi:hypothetical protein
MVSEEHFGGNWEDLLQIAPTRACSRFAASSIRHIVVAVTVAATEEIWSFWTVVRLVGNLHHKGLVGNLPQKRRLSRVYAHPHSRL